MRFVARFRCSMIFIILTGAMLGTALFDNHPPAVLSEPLLALAVGIGFLVIATEWRFNRPPKGER